jgi:hypothetical protein
MRGTPTSESADAAGVPGVARAAEPPATATTADAPGGAPVGAEPFRRSTGIALAVVGTISLALALLFRALSGDLGETRSPGADSFSRASTGHHALAAWLRASGRPVIVSRHRSAAKVTPGAVLLVAEPHLPDPKERQMEMPPDATVIDLADEANARGGTLVLVLPKWRAEPKPGSRWPDRLARVPLAEITALMRDVLEEDVTESEVLRLPAAPAAWTGMRAVPTIDQPQLLAPRPGLVPILSGEGGILVARVEGSGVIVVSDPDLLNTHGLGRGENAALVEELLDEQLRAGAVIIDETWHGWARPPSLWRDLLSFPLWPVTVQTLALLALACWAGMVRFGKPHALPPRVSAGNAAIVESTAQLLIDGERRRSGLPEYLAMTVRRAARHCSLPAGLAPAEVIERLAAIGRARGVREDLRALDLEASAHGGDLRLELYTALRIQRWAKEMTDGSRRG